MNDRLSKIAIVPGSFDPMTLGHLSLIEAVAAQYETVYVAVMPNFEKQPFLDTEARCEIARLTVENLPNVKVIADDGLLVDLFDRLHADAVCKGYRNETDLAYETVQDEWNRAHNPRFFTKLIPAKPGTEEISSTFVRRLLESEATLSGFVAENAIPFLQSEFAKIKRK
ncbi:MAG: pantetheine-phosphate adenylyltransferase [Ruminococcaceae bacterium]|nr:pantetheine-phosphate adenylyltransferase [Oscillospiraceae bacterium]